MRQFTGTIAQFFKFCVVGLSNTLISYAVYALLVYLGAHYIIANVAGFIIGVANSFFWSHKFVFKDETGGRRNLLHALLKAYASYAFSGFVVSSVLLYVFIDAFGASEYIAPFLLLPVTVPLNYILNKKWAFKPAKRSEERPNEKDQHTDTVL
ncbi:MAG: GtrA family protein [Chitinispirillia bacterium]|nr:GtrA family protein [Chitinispirillia bacterium]MCL2240983.1 GtrA family protein [Chitinispirillia bacterium]